MGKTKSAPRRPRFLTDKKMNNFGRGSQGPSVQNYFHIGPVNFDKKIFKVFRLSWQQEYCMECKHHTSLANQTSMCLDPHLN